MVSFGRGWLVPQLQALKQLEPVRRFGAPIRLLAWAPLIGDTLCLAAGWLRFNLWQAVLYRGIAYAASYSNTQKGR